MKIYRLSLILAAATLLSTAFFPARLVIADNPTPQIGAPVMSEEAQPSIEFSGCSPVYLDAVNAAYEQQVVEMVNAERENAGLPPLKRSGELDAAARYHARDMAEEAYFAHDSYDRNGESLVFSCSWSKRIEAFYPNRYWLGENIAAGNGTPAEVMHSWMNSSGHRENILNANYREFGVGYYQGGPWSSYWVQDFASRSSSYPLVIDLEQAATNDPDVDLYLYGTGVWNEMRLRNDGGNWGDWQPFRSNIQWKLDWAQGVHTVSVELRKSGQISAGAASSDSIELTTSGAQLGNLPDEIVFLYNIKEKKLFPGPIELNPQNLTSSLPLEWQVSCVDNWIDILNGSGTTPSGEAVILPGDEVLRQVGELTGSIMVSVTGGVQAVGSPKEIAVRLVVVPDLPNHVFLPSILR